MEKPISLRRLKLARVVYSRPIYRESQVGKVKSVLIVIEPGAGKRPEEGLSG